MVEIHGFVRAAELALAFGEPEQRRARELALGVRGGDDLPLLKWLVPSFPGITNDIKKPGGDEQGYDRMPLKALHSVLQAGRALAADLPQVTSPLLAFHSADDHVVDDASIPLIMSRVSSRDLEQRLLPESYHVATLDNDAPTIFEESAKFVARVTG